MVSRLGVRMVQMQPFPSVPAYLVCDAQGSQPAWLLGCLVDKPSQASRRCHDEELQARGLDLEWLIIDQIYPSAYSVIYLNYHQRKVVAQEALGFFS